MSHRRFRDRSRPQGIVLADRTSRGRSFSSPRYSPSRAFTSRFRCPSRSFLKRLPTRHHRRRQRRNAHRTDGSHHHQPIEDAVNSVPGLVTVRSTTSRGQAEVSLFFTGTLTCISRSNWRMRRLPKSSRPCRLPRSITTNSLTFATFPILGYSLTSDTVPKLSYGNSRPTI